MTDAGPEPTPEDDPEAGGAGQTARDQAPLDETGLDETDPDPGEQVESPDESAADSDPPRDGEPRDGEEDPDPEGPRRKARRERAERRVLEQRATAIEHARREAKRKVSGPLAEEPRQLTARTVKGLRLVVWMILLTVVSVILGLILYLSLIHI